MADIFKNIRGTTRDVFKIGKDGSNIFVRENAPSTIEGFDGDWCLINGAFPTILKKMGSEWVDISAHNLIPISTSYTYVPISSNDVILCNNTIPITITIDTVPPKGHVLLIKDSNGNSNQHNITINCTNGITIDGDDTVVINNHYTSLCLLSDGNDMYIM